MPNAVANFTSAFARYKAATAAPLGQLTPPQQPSAQQAQTVNPYASTYQPAANRPVAGGAPGPISATLESLRGLVKDKGYDEFVQKKAPAIDQALPLVLGLVGLIKGQVDQPKAPQQVPQQPAYATPTYVPTQAQSQPQPEWAAQVNQGIQGVAGLVNLIGGLFK
ncbi:hypothetical protein J7643_12455 [bacterium]|nr:hypothetical protein [bacterium]